MKRLLRSTFVAGPSDKEELLLRNVHDLVSSGLGFEVEEDQKLWDFISEFSQEFNHVPDVDTLRSHFKRKLQDEVVDRLEMLVPMPTMVQGNFKQHLEQKDQDRKKLKVQEILKDASTINMKGMEIRKEGKKKPEFLQGPRSAMQYLISKGPEIVAPTMGSRLSGDVTSNGMDFVERYDRVKLDPLAGMGQWSGIKQMDEAIGGLRRGELWVHTAFAGGLKTTLALNWVYNQAAYFKESSFYLSLEMPYEQIERIFYAMHSYHSKFADVRRKLGLQDGDIHRGLPYKAIRDGKLEEYLEKAEIFLKEYVVPDFNNPDCGYGSIWVETGNPDVADYTVPHFRQAAELRYSKEPFRMAVVDYAGLMAPRKWVSSTSERLNEVIRDLKRMALSFNRGSGLGLLCLHQINREGYKAALKMKERGGQALYNLTNLSYASEAERSADVVTSGWVDDDLREQCLLQIQNLKTRDDEPFKVFYARVEWPVRRLLTTNMMPAGQGGAGEVDNPQDDPLVDDELDIDQLDL